MKTSVTMKDIAKALGVSQTTVSFTLSGKANLFGISAETQERILKHVETIGYVPDLDAAKVAGREARRIGLMIANSLTENHKSIFCQLLQDLPLKGSHPLLYSVDDKTVGDGIRFLAGKKAEDVVIIGTAIEHFFRSPNVYSMVEGKRVYLVDFSFPNHDSKKLPLSNVVKIGIDRAQSYRDALALLTNLGHERVGAVEHGWQFVKELSGKPGHPVIHRIGAEACRGEDYFAMGYQILPEILRLREEQKVTAVMLGDDQLAIGLTSALLESGYKVPRDISVLGFDNIDIGAYAKVPLTTIDVPIHTMIDLVLSDLFTGREKKTKYVLTGKVILRESVGVAPH